MEFDDRSFQQFIDAAIAASEPVTATIETRSDEVERYWPVLEHGSRPGQKPWPTARKKTARGPGGNIFSRQAVGGFIFKNRARFLEYLKTAYIKRFSVRKLPLTLNEAQAAAGDAADQSLRLVQAAIPVDTGQAKDSLYVGKE